MPGPSDHRECVQALMSPAAATFNAPPLHLGRSPSRLLWGRLHLHNFLNQRHKKQVMDDIHLPPCYLKAIWDEVMQKYNFLTHCHKSIQFSNHNMESFVLNLTETYGCLLTGYTALYRWKGETAHKQKKKINFSSQFFEAYYHNTSAAKINWPSASISNCKFIHKMVKYSTYV